MQSWLEGRHWVGKGAQATGMTASLRILWSKADSNTWESFTRSGLKLESPDRGHAVSKQYLLANYFRGGLWNSGTSRLCNMLKMSLDQTVKRTPYIILQLSRAHNVSNHPSQNESRVIKHYFRCFIFSSCFEKLYNIIPTSIWQEGHWPIGRLNQACLLVIYMAVY